MDAEILNFIINHVFLPPKLPHGAEDSIDKKNSELLNLIKLSATRYREQLQGPKGQWDTAVKMLNSLYNIQGRSPLSEVDLKGSIGRMGSGDVITLHIAAQNAGLVLKHLGSEMLFTSFEASATSEAVIGTAGKLLISYPGPAIAVPVAKIQDPHFCEEFTRFAKQMNDTIIESAMPVSYKAGEGVAEIRNTADPKFITQMLTGILLGIGRPAEVHRFQKRIADDVLWDKVELPWRRSPLWLVVRVALQITLGEREQYKAFMVHFLSDILNLAMESGEVDSDLLFIMNTKLSRRAYKLRDQIPQFVLAKATEITAKNQQCLQARWSEIQGVHSEAPSWAPEKLSFEKDARLTLEVSRQYLGGVMSRKMANPKPLQFNATHPSRNPVATSVFASASGDESFVLLADFERWVQEELGNWTDRNLQYREEAFRELSRWINDYTAAARGRYESNPENMSIMFLTTYELWVSLDRIAVSHYPLLSDYTPEFFDTKSLFEPLLLPRYQQMERLQRIEHYIQGRCSRAKYPSIFSDSSPSSDKSFAVRYFNQSTRHKQLEERILADAQREKEKKTEEYHDMIRKHRALIARYNSNSCNWSTSYHRRYEWHKSGCPSCAPKSEADNMTIDIYEWPLPNNRFERMAVVFELDCPMGFSVWRDQTHKILVDICSPTKPNNEGKSAWEQLWEYKGLRSYYTNQGQRVVWSSSEKSFYRSHYSSHPSSFSVGTLCLDNALRYGLFDKTKSEWCKAQHGNVEIRKACTFALPDSQGTSTYRELQYAVDGYSHTSNEIISNQHYCPTGLSLHEFDAFGTLRAGHRLQWLNIAREIRARILTFNDEAVCTLFMQAAWQMGPPDQASIYRQCHTDLESVEFGETLLGELECMLTDIEANWLESTSARILVNLTTRLLSTNKHTAITERCFRLLRRARKVVLDWTRQLANKLQECTIEASMKDLQLRVLQVAAICRSTYDVDNGHLGGVLNSVEDVATLVECAIFVHDNTPVNGNLLLTVKNLLDRDRRLSHKIEQYAKNSLSQATRNGGLDQTVKQIYTSYTPGSASWERLSAPRDRWLTTTSRGGNRTQVLHYNILSGLLLIDGSPISRMPLNFVSHPTYQRLFNGKVLDVFPSSMPGMRYETRHQISDPEPEDPKDIRLSHQVHFTMHGNELVIRTRVPGSAEKYELIPHTKLSGDFPEQFVEEYVHWMNVDTGDIEFRPMSHPWTTTERNWHVSYSSTAPIYMDLGYERIVDIRSPTASMIGSVLGPLETATRIDMSFRPKEGKLFLSIRLPRLKLEFFINGDNELESRQFRGAIVDKNQNIGTLSGLVNRLVLCHDTVRSVIIPYGEVDFNNHRGHVRVDIHTQGLPRVQYFSYNIDSRLGRLVSNGSLTSHLYKAYLHAVTSHCLPDPLTRRTGAEEALDNLRSAVTWSFQKLMPEDIKMFRLIASLTPHRQYYPDHLRVMQTVKWKPIASTMQHDEYHQIVMGVFDHATRFHVLRERDEPEVEPYYKEKYDTGLLQRAAVRNSSYRKEEFGGSLLKTANDTPYGSRDSQFEQLDETHVYHVSRAVESWRPNLDTSSNIMNILEGWKRIGGSTTDPGFRLGYDHRWTGKDTTLGGIWGSVYYACCKSRQKNNTYQLMFFLSTLAYSGAALQLLGSLLAFATDPKFENLTAPCHSSYDLTQGYSPVKSELMNIIQNSQVSFSSSTEASWSANSYESQEQLHTRRYSAYKGSLNTQSEGFVEKLIYQWPCDYPNTPSDQSYRLLETSTIMNNVRPKFASWYRNKQFREHISHIQRDLNSSQPIKSVIDSYKFQRCSVDAYRRAVGAVRVEALFSRDAPHIPTFSRTSIPVPSQPKAPQDTTESRLDHSDLKALLDNFEATHSRQFEKKYATDMLGSLKALKDGIPSMETVPKPSRTDLNSFRDECDDDMRRIFNLIQEGLAPLGDSERLISMAGLWPCISPISLLQKLPTNAPIDLKELWKRALVAYGKSITKLQRSERLLACGGKSGREIEFYNEAMNEGHQEWDPEAYPDWLLVEIENHLLVRPVQTRIAYEMMKPTTEKNQVLQLNMGEGKSSVIVPIISAALADGERLVRVVVLKPLSSQMFRLLVQKLSGLTNRRIFSMPFSRAVDLDKTKVEEIRNLYQECAQVQGVLLVQPEHILSFKLIGLERLEGGDKQLSRILLDTQHWLEMNSRDILDESDEILRHENELIYTIGAQQSLENSPDRWIIVQEIFNLIKLHTAAVSEAIHQGIEVEKEVPGSFPVTRILKSEAGTMLLHKVASDVIKGHLSTVSFRGFDQDMRQLAYDFITDTNVDRTRVEPLLEHFEKDETSRVSLLLLRGLIAENIIFFALKEKRWRVNYGLTPKRLPKTLLAVPYRAKDIPAPRAEFSHPDVAITLTCLSYYYNGLSDTQLGDCFKALFKLSNPVAVYEKWIQGLDDVVPETLRKLSGINLLDDEERINTIFPLFRYNKAVVDFYLSSVVFPKHAKEFPSKLSSSGWDIGAEKKHPTTGFSGTNDNRDLLPLSVSQYERPEQLNTNAKVLNYLLQHENDYVCAETKNGERMDTDELLEMLVNKDPPIQVLLDVGAQVLELRNKEVADHWLSKAKASNTHWQAVVFFNENDELTVLSEDRTTEAFELSTFSKQMDQCLVYLDEVHTRGTDLKLPLKSRAAVTLGPNLTKDRLVQACMRMRKLGHGQSVLFCASPEIHRKILNITRNPYGSVSDVLHWCMTETCISNRNNVPIWAKQGFSFHRRDLAYYKTRDSKEFPDSLREQEAKSLEERFGLKKSDDNDLCGPIPNGLVQRKEQVSAIRERCGWFEVNSLRGAHAQEEQERELSYEVEREQQAERPGKRKPLVHRIHSDVRKFIDTGIITNYSNGFESAFGSMLKTSAADQLLNPGAWSSKLLVTKDFAETVETGPGFIMDCYLRPVRWIISSGGGDQLVIMSPYEVNEFLPQIRRSTSINLHIYSPKVTKGMVSLLEDLRSWTIPSIPKSLPASLANELDIFAGQIYLKDYRTYEGFCGFLGLSSIEQSTSSPGVKVYSDGFVEPQYRVQLGMRIISPFSESPIPFLRELIAFRRKDQDFLASHLGQIVHGRFLSERDFGVSDP
ncbi:hypothetical protein DFP73DRAFT_211814 [Morchella snyderi]|nr:hypothetical protein DFP73DRAFT_211814 [Morchella snyderi]